MSTRIRVPYRPDILVDRRSYRPSPSPFYLFFRRLPWILAHETFTRYRVFDGSESGENVTWLERAVAVCTGRFVTRFYRSTNFKDINSRTRLLAEGFVCWSEGPRKKREKNKACTGIYACAAYGSGRVRDMRTDRYRARSKAKTGKRFDGGSFAVQ